ncbi:MAG: hypothetical protein Kow0076_5030 [Francisella sp.]
MISKYKKNNGISLVEVLVVTAIMLVVSTIIINSLYHIRDFYNNLVTESKDYTEEIESEAIFRSLLENSYIHGRVNYSIFKAKNTDIGSIQDINPFDYPVIYAQQYPLIEGSVLNGTPDFPADAQVGTDVLVLQAIDSPQLISSGVTSGSSSITRVVNSSTPAVEDNVYMMITDTTNQTLLISNGAKTSTDSTIDLLYPITMDYPSGSTLYTNYETSIIYIRDTGTVDSSGNEIYQLYQRFYQTNNNGSGQVLLEGVSNMQISYNTGSGWQRVANIDNADNNYKRLWEGEIKSIKINYDLNGTTHEVIIAFNSLGS